MGTELHLYDLGGLRSVGQRLLEKSRRGFIWFLWRRNINFSKSGEFLPYQRWRVSTTLILFVFFCILNALPPGPVDFNNKPWALAFLLHLATV